MSILSKLFARAVRKDASPYAQARADNLAFLHAIEAVTKLDFPENRRALYESALRAWFLVPTPRKPLPSSAAGMHVLDCETAVSIPMICDADGRKVVPSFTDEQVLANWCGPSPWFALQGSNFFQAVANTDAEEVAVNPPAPGKPIIRPTVRLSRFEFEALGQKFIPT